MAYYIPPYIENSHFVSIPLSVLLTIFDKNNKKERKNVNKLCFNVIFFFRIFMGTYCVHKNGKFSEKKFVYPSFVIENENILKESISVIY